jgi:hypothetical protein
MKRFLAITIGIGMLATAGATAVSTQVVAASMDTANHSMLTAEQTKVLQAKYRYWTSSQPVALKAPI